MDPVSLTLGIAPLCLTAIKGLTRLSSKLKVFRHHRKEIRRIRKKLRIQQDWFRDEWHLLLLQIIDAHLAGAMMGDPNHPQWQAKEFEADLKSYLGSKYDPFHETIDEVRKSISELLEKLSYFAPPDTAIPLHKSAKDAFRIVFEKQDYYESLENLKELNAELRRLRKMASKIGGCRSKTDRLSIPSGYKAVQEMSSSLCGLVHTRISCTAGTSSHHSVKLLLESADETTPNINFLFEHKFLLQRTLLPIHVSSKDLGYRDSGILSPDSSPGADQSAKRQHIRNTHRGRLPTTTQPTTTYLDKYDECDGENLTMTRVKCDQLILGSTLCPEAPPRPLGYLDVKGSRRLILYPGLQRPREDSYRLKARQATPLLEFLKVPAYDVVSDKDRLKLAITLAKSMLKYNSTPWWPQEWTIGQVYVLREGRRDLSSSLDTLHLSMQIKPSQSTTDECDQLLTSSDEESHSPSSLPLDSGQYAMENYGVRNLTLYGLGVALLQIGLWDDVASKDYGQVRRKVARLSYLGKRYRDATKKLIDCDFGLATEQLDDVKLQSAIFTDVVGDLESLLHGLVCSGI
ncbi:hypothetical protein F5Y05DRAFT_2035 [Hypoxylon sp. FL0543]|nr:hypothetical protein F5Y05DRAFT_2035 [Hypoxylon sp. FL0543]